VKSQPITADKNVRQDEYNKGNTMNMRGLEKELVAGMTTSPQPAFGRVLMTGIREPFSMNRTERRN
jgi:hypothetical protein